MIGIIGGGFGLYGWLPALCQYYPNEKILIDFRHKEKFYKRPKLQQYEDRIEWMGNEKYIPLIVDLLILAIPPTAVYGYLGEILLSKTLKKIIVEKPICETPELSGVFIKAVEERGIKVCSSYLFIYTDWFKRLDKEKKYSITWIKSNNNPIDSWKHNPKLGGGKIFYLIHLLAVSTYFKNMIIDVYFNNKSDQLWIGKEDNIIELIDGCFPISKNEEDNRIPYLIQLLDDFENNYEKVNTLMKNTNELWKQEKLKLN